MEGNSFLLSELTCEINLDLFNGVGSKPFDAMNAIAANLVLNLTSSVRFEVWWEIVSEICFSIGQVEIFLHVRS